MQNALTIRICETVGDGEWIINVEDDTGCVMKLSGFNEYYGMSCFTRYLHCAQDNHVIPNLVAHGDTSTSIDVSKCELPLVLLGCNKMLL
jgi:hypothetical protein